jgi:tetratricopeptide (TPR) repeat protein
MNSRLTTFTGFFILTMAVFSLVAAEEAGDYIHYRLGVKYKNEKKFEQAVEEFRKVLAAYPDNYNAYMHLAEIRVQQKHPRLVIYNLKKALNYNPGWGKAHKMLAQSYEEDGQYQKAVLELQLYHQACDPAERDSIQNAINRLVARVSGQAYQEPSPSGSAGSTGSGGLEKGTPTPAPSPKTASKKTAVSGGADFDQAVELYNQKQYQASLDKLRQVLATKPGHSGAYYYAGLIRRRNGQNAMAKTNFLKATGYPGLGHNASFYLGKIYGEEKNYAEAVRHLSQYVARTGHEPGRKEALALLEQYRKSAGMAPGSPGESVDSAVVDAVGPSLEVRIDSMLSMMTIDTLTDAGRKLLGGINEFRAGNFDKAVKEFRNVLTTNPSGEVAVYSLYNTGVCYFKLRLFKPAENQFQMVIDRFGRHPLAAQSLFLKALSYQERGESGIGEKLFRNFIQAHRSHSWTAKAYEKLGDCYMDLEQPKKAIDAYSQVSPSAGPLDRVCAAFKLGNAYSQIGNTARALSAYTSAVETGEKHAIYLRVPDSYYKIADIKYQQKEYRNALDYYKKVSRKYPSYQETPWGLFQIGSIHKNLQNYKESIEIFKELLKRYPDDYWAKQAQWKMEDAVWEHEYRAVLK